MEHNQGHLFNANTTTMLKSDCCILCWSCWVTLFCNWKSLTESNYRHWGREYFLFGYLRSFTLSSISKVTLKWTWRQLLVNLSYEQPFCWCSAKPRVSAVKVSLLSSPHLYITITTNSVTSAACPFFHDCLCILCTPSPLFHTNMSHSPPPLSLLSSKPHPLPPPTWPSAVQLDAPVAGCMDAQWLPSTNCSLTLLPLCLFSCSLSLLLSLSLSLFLSLSLSLSLFLSLYLFCIRIHPSLLFCFHSDYLPISFWLPLLFLSPPSLPRHCRCSSRLTLHPSLSTNAPSLLLLLLLFVLLLLLLEIFKADQHTLAHSITHSSPAWEKHVSYSGPGPDCMLWEWSGEWQMRLVCLDTPGWFHVAGGSDLRERLLCGLPKERVTAAGSKTGEAGGGLSRLACHHLQQTAETWGFFSLGSCKCGVNIWLVCVFVLAGHTAPHVCSLNALFNVMLWKMHVCSAQVSANATTRGCVRACQYVGVHPLSSWYWCVS